MRIDRQRLVAVALLVLLLAAMAFPWASVAPLAETHQYIVATALKRLKADPAFATNLFPVFQGIESNEGVELTAAGMIGAGADGHGRSTYSEHYYNPITREGGAPTSVARYYSFLIRDNLANPKSSAEAGPKAAAYCAHFLADIFVPYHVNGASRATAERIWVEQQAYETMQVTLPQSITGLPALAYLAPLQRGNPNFYTALSRFIIMTEAPEFDWFDPWYYNGTGQNMAEVFHSQTMDIELYMVNGSSHIAWEGRPSGQATASAFHNLAGQGLDGYDQNWKNAKPGFQNPWVAQSEQARQFAIFKATETRTRQAAYFDNPTPSLRNAIRAVYTMWRGSISGLRPVIEYQPDGTAYRVTGKVTNAASAAASGVRAQLTGTDCAVTDAKEKAMAASLAAGKKQETSAVWRVQPQTGKMCKLKLEVIASYSIPDLQYAQVERTFFPAPQVQPTPPKPAPKPAPAPTVKTNPAAPVTATKPKTVDGRWKCPGVPPYTCSCIYPPEVWKPGCRPGYEKTPGCKDDGAYCGSQTVENANKIWEQKKAGKYSGWGEPGNPVIINR